jgi:hypothetical protein
MSTTKNMNHRINTIYASKLDHPVFNPIEVGNGKNDRSLANEFNRKLSIENLANLLSAKGKVEGYPGWVQSDGTLRRRVKAINKAVPDFQRKPNKSLEPYQVWVIVLCHLDFFKLTPANLKEAAIAIHQENKKYTYQEFKNATQGTTTGSQSNRDKARHLIAEAQSEL